MAIPTLQALTKGDPGNSTGADVASSVNQLITAVDNLETADSTLQSNIASETTEREAAQLEIDDAIRKSGTANSSLAYRLPFNHDHKTHLKYQLNNTAPLTRSKGLGYVYLDQGMKDLYISYGHNLSDFVKVSKVVDVRKFLVLETTHYINLDAPFTGDITIRVWPFQNGRSGLPDTTETQSLTMGSWQEITFSATAIDYLFRDDVGSVSYFYGIVDFVRLDQTFDSMDQDNSRLNAIGGSILRNGGWNGSPFMQFHLETDGCWYSDDITEGAAHSIDAGWNDLGNNTYNCTDLSDGSVEMMAVSTGEAEGKTLEFALNVKGLADGSALSTTLSNNSTFNILTDGTYVFTMTNEDPLLKRAFGSLTVDAVKIISIRIKVSG